MNKSFITTFYTEVGVSLPNLDCLRRITVAQLRPQYSNDVGKEEEI